MQVTYTNRKGKTYYLCQGLTKKGNPRYYFAREPKDEPVDEIPEGYEIRESVNGVVSLAKERPVQILPEERAAVEAAIGQHPKARNYRADWKSQQTFPGCATIFAPPPYPTSCHFSYITSIICSRLWVNVSISF